MRKKRPDDFPDVFHTLVCEFACEQCFDLNPTTVKARLFYKTTPDDPELMFLERFTAFTDVPAPLAIANSISFLERFFWGETPWLTTKPKHIEFRLHDLYSFLVLSEQLNHWNCHFSDHIRNKIRRLCQLLDEPSYTITYIDKGNLTNTILEPRQFAGDRPSATNWETGQAYEELFIASMKKRRNQ